jgi:phospholipase A1
MTASARHLVLLLSLCGLCLSAGVRAQTTASASNDTSSPPSTATPDVASPVTLGWQQCAAQTKDANARLACYDRWVQGQAQTSAQTTSAIAPEPTVSPAPAADCGTPSASLLSRFWELEAQTDCGRFNIRGYKPISLSYVRMDSVNTAPSSPTAGHTATSETAYLTTEARLQLSVRTKIGAGFLPVDRFGLRDSLWFGYTQQSAWQLFSPSISRPFRNTDHEPELIYILPTPMDLPGGWKLRYTGLSLNHQSNGQSLPLSRSWNRAILMTGLDKGDQFTVAARVWNRIPDGDETDDNPGIDDLVGRGEVLAGWNVNPANTVSFTLRHSLARQANGSYRLEWLRALGDGNRAGKPSGLRLHLQLFNGYGDSLVDYNQIRTVFSLGLSLVDW